MTMRKYFVSNGLRFSFYSEAKDSELLEDLEDIIYSVLLVLALSQQLPVHRGVWFYILYVRYTVCM